MNQHVIECAVNNKEFLFNQCSLGEIKHGYWRAMDALVDAKIDFEIWLQQKKMSNRMTQG